MLSKEIKNKILILKNSGESYREISKKLNISLGTINKYVSKNSRAIGQKNAIGRPKKISERNFRSIEKGINKHLKILLRKKFKRQIERRNSSNLSKF